MFIRTCRKTPSRFDTHSHFLLLIISQNIKSSRVSTTVTTKQPPMSPSESKAVDWRVNLLGPFIRSNNSKDFDEESPIVYVPTEEALKNKDFDYIALFFGANYCPHCRLFAPKVVESAPYFAENRCKVIFVATIATNKRSMPAARRMLALYNTFLTKWFHLQECSEV